MRLAWYFFLSHFSRIGFGGSFFQSGALGHGNKDTVLAAKPIAGLDKVKAIAAGEYHSLAVNRTYHSQLSLFVVVHCLIVCAVCPFYLFVPAGFFFVYSSLLMVSRAEAGQVFSWGLGELGRLGHGDSAAAMTPKLVEWLVPEGRAIAVSAGLQFSAALLENGSIYMWGSDAAKQLGNGDGAAYDAFQEFPTKVRSLPAAVKAVRVACGHKHTAMLDSEGNVWVWGNVGSFLPKRVEGLSQVTDISSGSGAVFAITKDGSVLSFTTTRLTDIVRAAHPLGHDANTPNQPTVLATLKAKGKAVSVAAGTNHAVAVIGTPLSVYIGSACTLFLCRSVLSSVLMRLVS